MRAEDLPVLQARLDRERTALERNRLGQHATPPALARAVVALGLSWLPPEASIRFLDPALGLGAFYAALQQDAPGRVAEATGVELDGRLIAEARRLWPALRVLESDFTSLQADASANLLVCNPPYVRHHHLDRATKARLAAAVRARTGLALPGLSGLYCAFLLLSRAWMAEGGVGVWLVPAEILDVGYASVARRFLCEQVTPLHLHRVEPGELQFPDATVSSAVIVLRNTAPEPGARVRLSSGALGEGASREIPLDALAQAPRWSPLFRQDRTESAGVPLGELFEIRRGVATGANDLFVMPRSRARALGLPEEHLLPFLPGPRALEIDEIAADDQGWPLLPDPPALLACELDEATVRARHPALWAWLERGLGTVSERYLCSRRRPWYAQERRAPAPLLVSYMGRGERPFRFVLNASRAIAPNVWSMLYPRPALARRIAEEPGLLRALRDQLAALSADALAGEARIYGGGLYKLEPGELARLRVPLS